MVCNALCCTVLDKKSSQLMDCNCAQPQSAVSCSCRATLAAAADDDPDASPGMPVRVQAHSLTQLRVCVTAMCSCSLALHQEWSHNRLECTRQHVQVVCCIEALLWQPQVCMCRAYQSLRSGVQVMALAHCLCLAAQQQRQSAPAQRAQQMAKLHRGLLLEALQMLRPRQRRRWWSHCRP